MDGSNIRKVALVTGGMTGFGEAICRRLADQQLKVVTTFQPHHDNADLWLREQSQAGYEFGGYVVDVSDDESCREGIGRILRDYGRVNVLVNNAGISGNAPLSRMAPDKWNAVLRTNLDSMFHVIKPVLDGMLRTEWGRIVNLAPIDARGAVDGQVNLSSARAGIHGFTMSLAQEVARKGITVNTVTPGHCRMGAANRVPTALLSRIPVGRAGEPAEVAGLVAYLTSREAAYITGVNIFINGGEYMV